MKAKPSIFLRFLPLALALTPAAHAETTWWDNTGADTRWTTSANFATASNGTGVPTGNPTNTTDVIFNIDGLTADQIVTTGTGASTKVARSLTSSTSGTVSILRNDADGSGTSLFELGDASTGGGITMNSGAGAFTIGTSGSKINMSAASSLTLENDSNSLLTFGGGWTSAAASGVTILSVTGSGTGGTFFTGAIADGSAGSTVALSINTNAAAITTLETGNSYSGGTTLDSGILAIRSSNALGGGDLTINGGTLASKVSSRTPTNNIFVGGDFQLGGQGSGINLAGSVNLGGATRAITVANTSEISGVISNGGLTIIGDSPTRTMTLSGNNTYSGATLVSAGTLLVNGALSNTSSVTASDGATVGGDGSITNALNIDSGAFLEPGADNGTVGSLVTGDLSLYGTYLATITANGVNDFLDITGAADFAGTVALVLSGYSPLLNDAFDIADWTGVFSGTPTFDYSAATLDSGLAWDSSTFSTDGTLRVVAIPEPAAALLGSLALLALLRRRR